MTLKSVSRQSAGLFTSSAVNHAAITDRDLAEMRDNFEKYYYINGVQQEPPSIKINWNKFKRMVESVPDLEGSNAKKGLRFFYCYDEDRREFYLKMQVGYLKLTNASPVQAPYSFIFITNEHTPYFEISNLYISKPVYPAIPHDTFDDGYFNLVQYSETGKPAVLDRSKHAHSMLYPWEYEIREMVDQNDAAQGGELNTASNPNLSLVIYFCAELQSSPLTNIYTHSLAFGLFDELHDTGVPQSSASLKGAASIGVFNNKGANYGGPCNPICATSPSNAYIAPDELNSIIEKTGY